MSAMDILNKQKKGFVPRVIWAARFSQYEGILPGNTNSCCHQTGGMSIAQYTRCQV